MDDDDGDLVNGGVESSAESLLPYNEWAEEALKHVVVKALSYVATNGRPGEHHFYVTFATRHRGVVMPEWLRAKYPSEITIVVQHEFWDLKCDEFGFSIGLSFNNIPTTVVVPMDAVTGFADPYAQFGLRFRPTGLEADAPKTESDAAPAETETPSAADPALQAAPPDSPQVVSLDAFRRRTPPKE